MSPTTAALWMSEPLPPSVGSWPPSMYFFALSQAPPVLLMEMANCTPDNREPVNKPNTAFTPKKVPAIKGERMTNAPAGHHRDNDKDKRARTGQDQEQG